MPEKPLFIPLAAKWFDAFESGYKIEEFRLYGPRWNERTCRVGRAAVLSYGYGTARRLSGTVRSFQIVRADYDPAIAEIWPDAKHIAAIGIALPGVRQAAGNPLPGLSAENLIARAVCNACDRGARKGYRHPRWVAVMDAFSLGSTYAAQLCRRYGLDPNETVKR